MDLNKSLVKKSLWSSPLCPSFELGCDKSGGWVEWVEGVVAGVHPWLQRVAGFPVAFTPQWSAMHMYPPEAVVQRLELS